MNIDFRAILAFALVVFALGASTAQACGQPVAQFRVQRLEPSVGGGSIGWRVAWRHRPAVLVVDQCAGLSYDECVLLYGNGTNVVPGGAA